MREARAQPLAVDVAARGLQRPHLGDVGGQRHRRRPDVLADRQELTGAIAAEVGQRVRGSRPCLNPLAPRTSISRSRADALDQRLEDRVRQPQSRSAIADAGRLPRRRAS